jgi:hypothetical protein
VAGGLLQKAQEREREEEELAPTVLHAAWQLTVLAGARPSAPLLLLHSPSTAPAQARRAMLQHPSPHPCHLAPHAPPPPRPRPRPTHTGEPHTYERAIRQKTGIYATHTNGALRLLVQQGKISRQGINTQAKPCG